MKTKRVGMTALLLALVSVLALAACTNPVLPDGDPPTAAAYILAVEDIGADITLQSKDKLLLAQTIYAGLSEEDKALDKVVDAKAQYDLKKAAYDILVAEQETKDAADAFKALVEQIPATSALTTDEAHQNLIRAARESYEELGTAAKALAVAAFTKLVSAETKMAELLTRETADAFIALVDALPGTVGLNDEAAVAAAEAAYAALGETAKAYTDVAAAKLRLDGARTALTDLASANAFIALANALPGTIGLNDEAAVTAARAAYDALSDNALAADGVSVALTKLQSAESRLTVLKAAKAAADAFIELVEALPSADDLAEDSLTAIVAAENAYDALNFDAKGMTGVAAANDTLTTLRAAYNAAFSVKSIPMQADALSFTGDDLTFDAAMLTAVATFYEVAQSALGGKVKMSLYAYFADETQYGNHLFELTLDVAGQTGTVQSAVIVQALKDAYIAGDYSNGVTPDRTYKFAIRFTDLTGNPKISQSEYSPFSPGRTFTYERPLSPAEAEAQAFLALAAHIPALGDMTTDNELRQLIGAARAAYDALGGDAKALDEVQAAYAKLQSAESRLAELIADEAAQGFIALAELISDQVTLADAAAIADARTYYDANVKNNAAVADRDEVKAAYAALAAAEESLAALVIAKEIEDFLDMIEAFSDPTTQAEVEAARAYYDAMSNEAKADDAVADALIVLESAEDYWMLKDIAPETLSSFSDVMLNPDLAWRGGPGFAQGFKAKYGDASMSDAKLLTLVHFRVFVHNAGDQNTALFYYDLQAGELTALGVSRLTDIFTQNRDLLTAAPGVEASYVFILQVLDARGAADESLRVHLDSATTACGGTFSYTKQPTAAEAEAQGFIDAVSAMPAPNAIGFATLENAGELAKVADARTVYAALGSEAKALVSTALATLEAAEQKITDLTAAKGDALAFLALMADLPATTDGLTDANYSGYESALDAAEYGYDDLSALARTYPGIGAAKTLLTALRVKFTQLLAEHDAAAAAALSAEKFIELVEKIGSPVTLADRAAIIAARTWYDEYVDGQLAAQQPGVEDAYQALEDAEEALAPLLADYEKVERFINAVAAINIPAANVSGGTLLTLKADSDAALAIYEDEIADDNTVNALPEVIDAKTLLDAAYARYTASYNALPQLPVNYDGLVANSSGYVWGASKYNNKYPAQAVSSGEMHIRVYFYNNAASNPEQYLFFINLTGQSLNGSTGMQIFTNALAANVQYLTARPGVAASYKVNLRAEDRTGNYKPSVWHGFQNFGGLTYTIPATNMQLFELAVEAIGQIAASGAVGTRITTAKTAWGVLTAGEQAEADMIALFGTLAEKEAAYFAAYAALANEPGSGANASAIQTAFLVYEGMLDASKAAAADAYEALIEADGSHFIALVDAVGASRGEEDRLTPASLGLLVAAELYLNNTLHEDAQLLDGTNGTPDVAASILLLSALREEWDGMGGEAQTLDMSKTTVVFGAPVYGTYNDTGYQVTLTVTVAFFADDDYAFVRELESAVVTVADNGSAGSSFALIRVEGQVGVYTATLTIQMAGTGARTFTASIGVGDEVDFADEDTVNAPAKTIGAHVNSLNKLQNIVGSPVVELNNRGIVTGDSISIQNTDFSSGVGRLAMNVYVGGQLVGCAHFSRAQSANFVEISVPAIKSTIQTQLGIATGTAVTFKLLLTCASAADGGERLYQNSDEHGSVHSLTL